jgi:hypothetical protein
MRKHPPSGLRRGKRMVRAGLALNDEVPASIGSVFSVPSAVNFRSVVRKTALKDCCA